MQKALTVPLIQNEDPLLDGQAAALYLGLRNKKTLDVWRCRRSYPELEPVFIGRSVMYRKSALEKFIATRTRKAPPAKRIKTGALSA